MDLQKIIGWLAGNRRGLRSKKSRLLSPCIICTSVNRVAWLTRALISVASQSESLCFDESENSIRCLISESSIPVVTLIIFSTRCNYASTSLIVLAFKFRSLSGLRSIHKSIITIRKRKERNKRKKKYIEVEERFTTRRGEKRRQL